MIGLKVHLILYGILVSMLTVSGLAAKHYYTEKVKLDTALQVAKDEVEFHKKEAKTLREISELDRIKTEELKKETEKALAELEKVKQNANVKVFLDTTIPDELNNWLRKRHSVPNDKAKNSRSVHKRNAGTDILGKNDKRHAQAYRGVKNRVKGLQQRQVLVAQIQ